MEASTMSERAIASAAGPSDALTRVKFIQNKKALSRASDFCLLFFRRKKNLMRKRHAG